jgi:hypothetical protein
MEPAYQPVEPQKHSAFGIASLALALLNGLLTLGCCLAYWIEGQVRPYHSVPEELELNEYVAIVATLLCCCGFFSSLLGIAIGIIGVAQRNVNRIFGILGLVFNGLSFLVYVAGYVLIPLIMLLVAYTIFGGMTF